MARNQTPQAIDVTQALEHLGRLSLRQHSMQSLLQTVADLTKTVMPGHPEASVSLPVKDTPSTVAYTDQLAFDLDATQCERDHGPCLHAARSGAVTEIADTRKETRWPDYVRRATQRGALSSLSVPLAIDEDESHPRCFWGLRLHLVCTPAGLPVTWALADPKLDERQVLMCLLNADAALLADRPGLLLIADKGYVSAELDDYLLARGAELLRLSYRNRASRPDQHLLAPIRQLIESVYDTLKGQLDLELHGGRTLTGVTVRVAQRLLALTEPFPVTARAGR